MTLQVAPPAVGARRMCEPVPNANPAGLWSLSKSAETCG